MKPKRKKSTGKDKIAPHITQPQRKRAEEKSILLAGFPRENPNPALASDGEGNIIYINLAAKRALKKLGVELKAGFLPKNHPQLVRTCLESGQSFCDLEVPVYDHVYSWSYHPHTALNAVHLYGVDITERKRAEKQAQRHLQRITVLREIDQAITSTLDLHAVLDFLLQKVDLLLPYSATTVRLFNKESGLLEPIACRNVDEEEWKAERWKAGRGTPNLVFETRAPVITRNVQTDSRVRDPEFFRRQGLVSYLGVPLIVKKEILGVLSFYTKKEHEFSSEEVEFLSTLAGQAAIAIHNSQLYEEMKTLAGDLARSNKVKDEFLSVMSHELRTPLNVVMGYTGMVQDGMLGKINQEQKDVLGKVIASSDDLLAMINSILYATTLEAKAIEVESHEISLGDFLDKLRSAYSVPSGKELTFTWDYPPQLPFIKTDSTKLKHILQNLINNAVKFTKEGSVTISVRLLPEAKAVEFKVKDTGIGISKEALPFIFEKFRQVDSSETRLYGGVGLGLYIVKQFTDMLGGKVEVDSEAGKGSTFTVTIPFGNK